MRRITTVIFGMLVCVTCLQARAQTGGSPPTVKTDTTGSKGAVVTIGSASASRGSIDAVQKRIAEISGRGRTRVIVQPVIIVLQAPQGLEQTGRTPVAVQDPVRAAIPQERVQPPPPAERIDQRVDETEPPVLRDTVVVMLEPTIPDSVRIQIVERALLETGLFETTDINFEFDRSTLLSRSEQILDAVGDVLVRYPEISIEIAGHTDSVGRDEYNQRLSEARAAAVRNYLLQTFSITPARLEAVGYGESKPTADNVNETGRALNRRVEFRVTSR